MTRLFLIRRIVRSVFGEQMQNDSNVTDNLVNALINDAIGVAIKQNWKESVALDGVEYINDSFVTTYKGMAITKDENFVYTTTLAFMPSALGKNYGIQSLKLRDIDGNVTKDLIPLSNAQWAYYFSLRDVPNKTFYKSEGKKVYIMSKFSITAYTASATIISAGGTDLESEVNVPDDYINIIDAYVSAKLKGTPMVKDLVNDGVSI